MRITIPKEELNLNQAERILLAIAENDIRMGSLEERHALHADLDRLLPWVGPDAYKRLMDSYPR